jgi:hypothetical protein
VLATNLQEKAGTERAGVSWLSGKCVEETWGRIEKDSLQDAISTVMRLVVRFGRPRFFRLKGQTLRSDLSMNS